MRARFLLLALLAGLVPAATGHAQSIPSTSSSKAVAPELPLPILQSLAYVDIESGRALQLTDGVYEDARRHLRLEPTLYASGDLDGDSTRDAAVLREERNKASGVTTLHIAAVVQRAFRVRNLASLRLGEHVQVRALAIDNRHATLSLIVMGEGDDAFRPTLKMTLALKLAGSEWHIMRQEPGGRFKPADLSGTAWKLAAGNAITAHFAAEPDGTMRLAGRTICARYAATMDETGAIAEVTAFAPDSAKTPCSAEAHESDRAFLAALAQARRIEFRFGRLALAGERGAALAFVRE